LHLGEKTVIRTDDIIGIFDLDTSTISKNTRDFLSQCEKEKKVINVSFELPKSFILCREKEDYRVYISQISSQTLLKRNYKRMYENEK
ncbi:MAG: extracellular matrix regulator RemB, partial [Ruminococcus sp.]